MPFICPTAPANLSISLDNRLYFNVALFPSFRAPSLPISFAESLANSILFSTRVHAFREWPSFIRVNFAVNLNSINLINSYFTRIGISFLIARNFRNLITTNIPDPPHHLPSLLHKFHVGVDRANDVLVEERNDQ